MSIVPFMGLFFKHLGLSPSEIGFVTAARPVAIALFQPVVGVLIDTWQCPKFTVAIAGSAWIGSTFVMGFCFPKPVQKSCEVIQMEVMQSNKSLILEIMHFEPILQSNLTKDVPAGNVDLHIMDNSGFTNDNPTDDKIEDRSWLYTTESVQTIFYVMLIAHILFGIGYVPLHSIADAESVNSLQELDIDMAEYGKQRAFGSLGWGFA